jgi:hypothetical protein
MHTEYCKVKNVFFNIVCLARVCCLFFDYVAYL